MRVMMMALALSGLMMATACVIASPSNAYLDCRPEYSDMEYNRGGSDCLEGLPYGREYHEEWSYPVCLARQYGEGWAALGCDGEGEQ